MVHRGRQNKFDRMMIEPAVLRPQLLPDVAPIRRQPPDHLEVPERQIWKHILADYQLSTETAFHVLVTCLENHMRARQAREVIDKEGMVTIGRDGQQKAHPLLAVERDSRAAWLSGIKLLGLEL
jgi:P27 family predicted phage terminase small subunit